MRPGKYMFTLFMGCVLSVASSAHAAGTMYYSTTDPGTSRPPAAPWAVATDFVPPPVGQPLWLGMDNRVLLPQKDWTINLPPGFGKETSTGYVVGDKLTGASGVTISFVGGTLKIRFTPQPDWEVVKLIRLAAGEGRGDTISATGYSACSSTRTDENTMNQEARIGTPGDDQLINEIHIYPVGGTIGLIDNQLLTVDGGGTWAPALSATDPNGVVRPGVVWTVTGTALSPSNTYNMTLEQAGPAVTDYDLFAFDTVQGEFQEFATAVPPPIPAISEWGLIVLALIVFTVGTIALGRKRKLATA